MADPKKQSPDPRAVRDLAAALFAAAYQAARGTKIPEAVAVDAIAAARTFFAAWEADQTPPG